MQDKDSFTRKTDKVQTLPPYITVIRPTFVSFQKILSNGMFK